MTALTTRLLILLLSAAGPVSAFFGGKTAAEDQTALLWVPDTRRTDFEALHALLLRYPDVRLTLAAAPADIPKEARPWLKEWVRQGRLEVALRITGDPILPLIDRYRRRDVPQRVALSRILYRKIFERDPAGFVPGAGALSQKTAAPLERQKFKWASVGDSAFRTAWYSDGDLALIPFHVPISSAPAFILPAAGARAVVLSELDGPLEPGSGIETLRELFDSGRVDRWTTVSAALTHMRPYAVGPGDWPAWTGGIDLWEDHPLQQRAWNLYGETITALQKYRNSGGARLSTLKRANAAIYRAQSSAYFRVRNLRRSRAEKSYRRQLSAVYRRMGRRPPTALSVPVYQGLPDEAEEFTDESPGPAAKDDANNDAASQIRSGAEDNSLFFENPEGSAASLPKHPPELPPGTTAQDIFTPLALRAGWDETAVTFTFALKNLVNISEAPNGFDSVMLELYMDLNNLNGRGSTSLLPKRHGFLHSKDAWEYALVANGWRAGLYRSLPGQPPVLVARLAPETSEKKGEIRIAVPRRKLRGNPAAWGYLLVTTASNEGGAARDLPLPLPGAGGTPLLGMLGPLDAQTQLAEAKSSYRRFSALRIIEEAPGKPGR